MYEDWTQNYDTEIHEEYVIHDTPLPCHSFMAMCTSIAMNARLKGNNFLL